MVACLDVFARIKRVRLFAKKEMGLVLLGAEAGCGAFGVGGTG